jgi:hypothetical protein
LLIPAGNLGYADAVVWSDFWNVRTGESWRKKPSSSFWVQLLPYLAQHRYQGALSSGERISLNKISDGLSQTVFYGEALGRRDSGSLLRTRSWVTGGLARMRGASSWMTDLGGTFNPSDQMLGNHQESSEVCFSYRD